MKDIEKICGSSLDHFLILDSSTQVTTPTITFVIKTASPTTISIKDADNEEWEGLTLIGTADGVITSNTFVTKNNAISTGLSLLECLKKNSVFFNFSTPQINGSQISITCSLEMSRTYNILSSNSANITVSASTGGVAITKYVVDMDVTTNNSTSNLSLSKMGIDNQLSFNLTAPFSVTSFKYPMSCTLFSYRTDGIDTNINTLNTTQFYILPTTLHKFDWVDFSNDYFKDVSVPNPKPILTTNNNKTINYGETIALSFLTNDANISLLKRYYTNSGRYLTQEKTNIKKEYNLIRVDFYDTPDLLTIEQNYNTQVGFVLYNIVDSANTIISNDLRYDVVPSCNPNNIVFFINELGGIDSFNFLGDKSVEYNIDDQLTYSTTPTRPFTNSKFIEQVKSKYQSVTHTTATALINSYTADWLNELNKSKYVFILDEDGNETRIIVDKFDIEVTYDTEQYELEMQYHRSDNKIRL